MQILKKRALALLLAFLLVAGSSFMLVPRNMVSAETGNVDWSWDDNGTLTIFGTGEMKDYSRSSLLTVTTPWCKNYYEDDIVTIKIENGVTSIGDYAFFGCTKLTNVFIPDSVTRIGENAFGLCKSLTNITIPDSVTSIEYFAFAGCSSLTSIVIPDGVTNIDGAAFQLCTNLTSVTIPDSVISIGESAFFGCSNLKTVYYDGSKEQWRKIDIDDLGGANERLHNADIVFAESPSDSETSSEPQSSITNSASSVPAETENATTAPSGNNTVMVVLIVLVAVLAVVVVIVLIRRRRLNR